VRLVARKYLGEHLSSGRLAGWERFVIGRILCVLDFLGASICGHSCNLSIAARPLK
jgi:hypothetical protein